MPCHAMLNMQTTKSRHTNWNKTQHAECASTSSLWQSGGQRGEGSRPAAVQVGQQLGDDGEGRRWEEAWRVSCLDQRSMCAQHCVVLHHCHPCCHQLPGHQFNGIKQSATEAVHKLHVVCLLSVDLCMTYVYIVRSIVVA